MSADDAAVCNSREALDLASALIKLSRFAPTIPDAVLATGLAQSAGSVLNARIARLMAWNETRLSEPRRSFLTFAVPVFLGGTLCVMATLWRRSKRYAPSDRMAGALTGYPRSTQSPR